MIKSLLQHEPLDICMHCTGQNSVGSRKPMDRWYTAPFVSESQERVHDLHLGYVARSSSRAEIDATKALEFILEVSEAHEIAKAGFTKSLRQIQPQLPDLTRFHTDATQTGAGIPDLVGSDRGSQPWALIENKFHAALTVHQPIGYLAKLPPGGLLLFIVPDFRQRPIQRTIDDKLRQDGIKPPVGSTLPNRMAYLGERLMAARSRSLPGRLR